jgi:hypothetical protein
MTPADIARKRATKVRLMRAGWKFIEDCVGGTFYVRMSHMRVGGLLAHDADPDEALAKAVTVASHAQARFDSKQA